MIPQLPSWWEAIQATQPGARPPRGPSPERLRDPLSLAPRHIAWTDDLDAWSRIDYEQPMSSMELAMLQRAWAVRGANAERHAERRRQAGRLKNQLGDGYRLPGSLEAILLDDQLFNRFRFPSQQFTLPDTIVAWPAHPSLLLYLVLADAQGCHFTHLLLAPDLPQIGESFRAKKNARRRPSSRSRGRWLSISTP